MRFFTDRTVINQYLLIKITDYLKLRSYEKWREILIDPGVYDLIKSPKFKWEDEINVQEFLNSLPPNHFFSFDYPCDMNEEYSDLFLEKTWKNALKYHEHPQYIVTTQSRFKNYWNFTECFDKYNELNIASGIMGIGNLCRILFLTEFMKHSLDYAFKHCNHERIHIYGLGLRSIPYAYYLAKKFNIKLSVDSTKWTRPCTVELKKQCGLWFKHKYRQDCFDAYLDKIKKRGIELENG